MKAQQRQVKDGDQAVLGLIIIFHLANYKHECKVIHQLAAYPLCVIYCMPSALAPLSPVETEVTSAERALCARELGICVNPCILGTGPSAKKWLL